ncbi:Homogentisate 1,2-dioxygenase [Leucoagaricus sp. SymC.cos]|nr:Homogentisate 1,2-dioxygenase [Leucoagaricus sp. SymC.cos]
MPPSTTGATAQGSFATKATSKDPYRYQVGFGNRFASEALPGALPHAQNNPQKNRYDLYSEEMTGSPFIAPRGENLQAWLYRIRPSVAHQGFTRLPDNPDIESCFLPLNPKVHISPTQLAWYPFKLPTDTEKVDWVEGLKTVGGNGDPTLREGLAIHMYLANTSMDKRAFCNGDGDMLICPQQGRLDIQTEFGKLMIRPGELCVIQRGMKFKVILPDGPSRGYILEIFGAHFILPDLGPLGGNGLANPRDFESPTACFEIDQSPWEIVYKVAGELHASHQEHTPFDVVAWSGNYVPYKYDMEKFVYVGSISRDHIDPSIFCVLTAKSKQTGIPLAELLIFGERLGHSIEKVWSAVIDMLSYLSLQHLMDQFLDCIWITEFSPWKEDVNVLCILGSELDRALALDDCIVMATDTSVGYDKAYQAILAAWVWAEGMLVW